MRSGANPSWWSEIIWIALHGDLSGGTFLGDHSDKRQAFREAFHFYDAQKIAQMTDADLDALLDNPNIVRNKMKIYATRANAQAFLAVQKQFGSF